MIKFFRKIRQNLLSEGKTSKYLKYAIGEIVLVVVGILIALQINNWNEERKLKAIADAYVERLINDIVADTTAIHASLSIRRETIANIEAYFEHFNTMKMSINTAIDSAINVQTELWRYFPRNQTYEDMKSTGNLNLLSQPQQKILSELSTFQQACQLFDEKMMAAYYEQAELANNYLERRSFTPRNQRSSIPFKSVYEMFELKEDPQRLAQGLIHRHNTLTALKNYHGVATNNSLGIIKLSNEAINVLKSQK